ncbi:MAG: hypothetical protein QXS29_10080 [Nitrososphaeria archaeon]
MKLIEKRILAIEQICQYPLIVPSQDSFLKLFLEEETHWEEGIAVLLATLFQSGEIESITKEQSKYLCYDFEVLKENRPKKTKERIRLNEEEYVLEQIHRLLENLDRQEIVKSTLLEQLYTIASMQDDTTIRRVKEAIYVYVSLLGGSIL